METGLVLAVIQRAIKNLEVKKCKVRAKMWLESESTECKSFLYYCELINLSPHWALRKIKEKGIPIRARRG